MYMYMYMVYTDRTFNLLELQFLVGFVSVDDGSRHQSSEDGGARDADDGVAPRRQLSAVVVSRWSHNPDLKATSIVTKGRV